MKDRETIETLNNMKSVFGERGHSQYSLAAIGRAIEMQIPKDLIEGFKGCPICETYCEYTDFCSSCGQKLHWY